jgi:hypothetical protein
MGEDIGKTPGDTEEVDSQEGDKTPGDTEEFDSQEGDKTA